MDNPQAPEQATSVHSSGVAAVPAVSNQSQQQQPAGSAAQEQSAHTQSGPPGDTADTAASGGIAPVDLSTALVAVDVPARPTDAEIVVFENELRCAPCWPHRAP